MTMNLQTGRRRARWATRALVALGVASTVATTARPAPTVHRRVPPRPPQPPRPRRHRARARPPPLRCRRVPVLPTRSPVAHEHRLPAAVCCASSRPISECCNAIWVTTPMARQTSATRQTTPATSHQPGTQRPPRWGQEATPSGIRRVGIGRVSRPVSARNPPRGRCGSWPAGLRRSSCGGRRCRARRRCPARHT